MLSRSQNAETNRQFSFFSTDFSICCDWREMHTKINRFAQFTWKLKNLVLFNVFVKSVLERMMWLTVTVNIFLDYYTMNGKIKPNNYFASTLIQQYCSRCSFVPLQFGKNRIAVYFWPDRTVITTGCNFNEWYFLPVTMCMECVGPFDLFNFSMYMVWPWFGSVRFGSM